MCFRIPDPPKMYVPDVHFTLGVVFGGVGGAGGENPSPSIGGMGTSGISGESPKPKSAASAPALASGRPGTSSSMGTSGAKGPAGGTPTIALEDLAMRAEEDLQAASQRAARRERRRLQRRCSWCKGWAGRGRPWWLAGSPGTPRSPRGSGLSASSGRREDSSSIWVYPTDWLKRSAT